WNTLWPRLHSRAVRKISAENPELPGSTMSPSPSCSPQEFREGVHAYPGPLQALLGLHEWVTRLPVAAALHPRAPVTPFELTAQGKQFRQKAWCVGSYSQVDELTQLANLGRVDIDHHLTRRA